MSNTDLWEFKFAPQTFEDMILDDSMRSVLKKTLTDLPNMTLAGPPGCGKGTFMEILQKANPEMSVLRVNGSDTNGVDDIRDRVKPFAESMGFGKGVNLVYLNEADRLSAAAQDMLRDLIEKVQDITRFVMCCNYPERLTNELKSRCPLLMFVDPPIKPIALRMIDILKKEKVEFKNADVVNLVKSTYPDIRHTINMLKFNVVDGALSSNLNIVSVNEVYEDVLKSMMSGDPSKIRKMLRSNPIDYTKLYTFLYDKILTSENDVFKNDFVAITEVAEGAYRDDIVAIKEINFMGVVLKMLKQGAI